MSTNLPGRIANAIIKTQRGFAGYFGRKTAGLGKRGKMVFLIGVCLVFGGLGLSSIVKVFISTGDKTIVLQPGQVAVPEHFDKTGEPPIDETVIVSPALYKRLQVFKIYMDSLRRHSKPAYDSIVRARPGLMDSVLFLEKIYSEQNR